MTEFQICAVGESRCADCGLCHRVIICPSPQSCIGCGACVAGCPHEARSLVLDERPRGEIAITVDGQAVAVPEGVTLKPALEDLGFTFGIAPADADLMAIDSHTQLCVLDYFPTFRRRNLPCPFDPDQVAR